MAANYVADETIAIWNERRKSAKQREKRSIVRSMHRMYEIYKSIKKHSNRNTDTEEKKRADFMVDMKEEFDIEEQPEKKLQKIDSDAENTSEREPRDSESDCSNDDESDSDFDEPAAKKARKKQRISPELVMALDDAGLSDYKATSVILSMAKALGIDIATLSASRSTVHRERDKIRDEITKQIIEKFGRNLGDAFLVLHWDGKVLQKWRSVDGKSDRVAIVVTNGKDSKILGAVELEHGTSVNQFNAIKGIVDDWDLTNNIKAICFDTTSTNTGERQGICKRFRDLYKGEILTLACRRHMMELVLSKGYETALKDDSKSPNITLFERFKSKWNEIDVAKKEDIMKLDKVKRAIPSMERKQIVEFVRQQITLQNVARKDYLEFLQLVLLILGENDNFHIRVPGALHRARFMARVIFSLKILLLRNSFTISGKYMM